MAKRVSARRIKIHRQYTYEEAAELLGLTVQTVRSWRHKGLLVLTGQRQHLILGAALKEFLDDRAIKAKRKLDEDQLLCMACNAPRRPYGQMADYVPINAVRGKLIALCEVCEGTCVRFARHADLVRLAEKLSIEIHTAE